MSGLQISNYEGTPVRIVEREDGLWWVLKDVCGILKINNTADVAAHLDDDEKGIATIDTPGEKQEMLIINEPGLYNTIFRSAKPEAPMTSSAG